MALILIIEDDATTRMLFSRSLCHLPETTVVAASTLAEAREMLKSAPPDLVLLDLRLPDGTGLDILDELSHLDSPPGIMVVSAFPEDLPQRTRDATRLTLLSKPVSAGELRCRVLEALQLSRPPSPFSLPEYLQMACLGGHSLLLLVTGPRKVGYVAVFQGDVWAASYAHLRAFEAFQAMLSLPDCNIEARPWPEYDLPRQLAGGYEELLLEACRRRDESSKELPPELPEGELDFSDLLRSLSPPPAITSGVPAKSDHERKAQVAELVSQGVHAVVSRDYHAAAALLEQAHRLDPDNPAIEHRLRRLHQLGYGTAGSASTDVA